MSIFSKIIDGSIPSYKIYEDEMCLVILDINPIRKGHCLVISKDEVESISKLTEDVSLHLFKVARKLSVIMRDKLSASGINIFINDGPDAGQEVPHVHIHVVPRFKGDGEFDISKKQKYSDGDAEKYVSILKF